VVDTVERGALPQRKFSVRLQCEAKRLAGKNVSETTYSVSCGTRNLNSVSLGTPLLTKTKTRGASVGAPNDVTTDVARDVEFFWSALLQLIGWREVSCREALP